MTSVDLKQYIDVRESFTVEAVRNDEVVGFARLIVDERRNGDPQAIVVDIRVNESYRRQGIGRQLMDAVKARAKRQKCYKIVLTCADHNVPFYESCGFTRHQNGMRCDLDLQV